MNGINSFKEYFRGFENEYVIIGGTACDLLMSHAELSFRATKDIDMVLIIETLTKEFGDVFWSYIKDANYQFIYKGHTQFYRFSKPKSDEYPAMIELFSKNQDWLPDELKKQIIPIHIDDNISSLSAILLDDTYYNFLLEGITVIDEISVLKAEYIIPFKAKAWLGLTERKENGIHVDSRDIKKHKNDIFRLSMLLTPDKKILLPKSIKEDMSQFILKLDNEEINIKQLGIYKMSKESILQMLTQIYI
ncbi:MAG: hypothetical protein LUG60_04615 [Erysipelotrichaceae bacterium]|nr:hypothetical protein [Erysipelotrichaceae bacterium]